MIVSQILCVVLSEVTTYKAVIVMLKHRNVRYALALFVSLFAIIGHLYAGYVLPTAACAIMAIAYITIQVMHKLPLTLLWIACVYVSYFSVDYFLYSEDGIPTMMYKYCIMAVFILVYTVPFYILCTTKIWHACIDKDSNTGVKKHRMKSIISLYGFYSVPVSLISTVLSISYTLKDNVDNGVIYISVGTGILFVMIVLHLIIYTAFVLCNLSLNKKEKADNSLTSADR